MMIEMMIHLIMMRMMMTNLIEVQAGSCDNLGRFMGKYQEECVIWDIHVELQGSSCSAAVTFDCH